MSKRIESAMSAAKFTQTSLAAEMGVTPQAVQQWVAGSTTPKGKRLEKLASVLGVSVAWLLTERSEIGEKKQVAALPGTNIGQIAATLDGLTGHFQGQVNPAIESNAILRGGFDVWDDDTPLRDDEVELNFYREVELSAGSGRYQVIENHGRKLRFSKTTLKRHGINIDQAACVSVAGNSMEPVLPDGCTIGIDTGKTEIKNGDLYAIDHDGHLRVKMLYKMPGDVIRLRSYNSDEWPDEHYSGEAAAKIRIIGRVFWWSVLR